MSEGMEQFPSVFDAPAYVGCRYTVGDVVSAADILALYEKFSGKHIAVIVPDPARRERFIETCMRSVPAAVYDRLDGNAFAQSTIRMAESIQESARLLALHRLTVGKGPGGVNIGIEPSVRLRAAQEFQLFVDLRKATVDVSA